MMHWPQAAPTLAQVSGLDAKAPPPLPDPPFFAQYFLESPTLLIALLLGAAVLTFFILNASKPRRARQAAGVFLGLAVALLVTSSLVQTPREKAIDLAKNLVHAVAAGDTRTVDAALAPSAAVYSDTNPKGEPKALILDKVGSYFGPGGQLPLEDHAILVANAYMANPSLVQVQVKVRTTPKGFGPVLSWWQLDMIPAADGWQVSGIRYLSSNYPFQP